MKIYNPNTNRYIDSNSRTFKNLLKEFNFENNILVPKDKSKYGYSTSKIQYIKKDKIPKQYIIDNGVIQLKEDLVRTPNNRYIKINNKAYKKYLKLGYQNINNTLIKNTSIETINNVSFDNLNKKKFNKAKIISFNINNINEKITYYYNNYKSFLQWFKNISYSYEGLDYNLDIISSNDDIKFGPSFDGKLNCFINCIETHLNKQKRIKKMDTIAQFYKDYSDGVFEEDIENIAHHYKLLIRVHENNNIYEYGKKEYTKNKNILNLKYFNNHVEIINSTNNLKQIIKLNRICNCIDNLKFNEEFKHTCSLEDILETLDINSIENITSDCKKTITSIYTKDKIYKYKDHYNIELDDNEYTIYDKISKEIFNYFSNPVQSIKSELEIADELLHTQIFYNEEIKPFKEYKVIDLKNAYDNFNELPTDLLIKVKTNKMHEELGFYHINYICPIRKIELSEWHFTEYLNILNKHNIKYTIEQAMLSSGKTTLNIQELNNKYKKIDKRYFHIMLGKWHKREFIKNAVTTDELLFQKYGGIEYNILDTKLYKIPIKTVSNTNNYYPHIVSAIHEYTNAKILDTVLSLNLKPKRIWIDGIVLENYPKNIPDIFRKETKIYKESYNKLDYFNHKKLNNLKEYIPNLFKNCNKFINYIQGSAGTGKSKILNDIANNTNALILTPTKMILNNFQTENKMTFQNFIIQYIKNIELILIDEASMLNNNDFNIIKNKCNCKIILFGDQKQLPVIKGIPINTENINIIELTKIYRQTDSEFVDKLLYTYNTGKIDYIKSTKSVKHCITNNLLILSPSNNEINRINKLGYKYYDTEIINEEFKVNMPIIVDNLYLKHLNIYTGDRGKIINYNNIEKIVQIQILDNVYNLTLNQLKNIKPAFSITYHRIQGQTINDNICINLRDIEYFNECKNNMLYVGVSRVRQLNQLNILK